MLIANSCSLVRCVPSEVAPVNTRCSQFLLVDLNPAIVWYRGAGVINPRDASDEQLRRNASTDEAVVVPVLAEGPLAAVAAGALDLQFTGRACW